MCVVTATKGQLLWQHIEKRNQGNPTVKLEDDGDTSGELELDDLVRGELLKVHDDGSVGVAVGDNLFTKQQRVRKLRDRLQCACGGTPQLTSTFLPARTRGKIFSLK